MQPRRDMRAPARGAPRRRARHALGVVHQPRIFCRPCPERIHDTSGAGGTRLAGGRHGRRREQWDGRAGGADGVLGRGHPRRQRVEEGVVDADPGAGGGRDVQYVDVADAGGRGAGVRGVWECGVDGAAQGDEAGADRCGV